MLEARIHLPAHTQIPQVSSTTQWNSLEMALPKSRRVGIAITREELRDQLGLSLRRVGRGQHTLQTGKVLLRQKSCPDTKISGSFNNHNYLHLTTITSGRKGVRKLTHVEISKLGHLEAVLRRPEAVFIESSRIIWVPQLVGCDGLE